MKRQYVLTIICSLLFIAGISQDAFFVDIPPGKRVLNVLKDARLLYADSAFQNGTITYKNGKTKAAVLNYNVLLGEMEMIRNGDTVVLTDANVASVTVGNENYEVGSLLPFETVTFYVKVERDYDKMRLVSKKVFAFVQKTPLKDDNTRFNLRYTALNNSRFLKDVVPVDTLRLATFDLLYIANVKNQLMAVHRSTLIQLYPHREKAILDYLRDRVVPVYDKPKVIALLDFAAEKIYNR